MTLCWSELLGSKVGVFGLGVEGAANLRKLQSLGISPVLVDDAPSHTTFEGVSVLETKSGGIDALMGCEVVLKSPGISRHRKDVRALTQGGVHVAGGMGLWLAEVDRTRVVCVTGTKGKSTTVCVAGHLLCSLGYRAMIAGNIGVLPYDPTSGPLPEYWIVEISSFQATDLFCSTPITAVTSLHPDHLDWHGDADTYYSEKLSMCSQKGARLTVANGNSPILTEHISDLGPQVRWVTRDDTGLIGGPDDTGRHWLTNLGLSGDHLRTDALIARACLIELGITEAHSDSELSQAAIDFVPLPSRMTEIGTIAGVRFVDDGLSTNVFSTLGALRTFIGSRLALIVGGFDRGIDYGPLGVVINERDEVSKDIFVATLPASGPRIHRELSASVEVVDCDEMDQAVKAAFEWASPDGIVLLSPAAPSFGQYANYEERSQAFANAMELLR